MKLYSAFLKKNNDQKIEDIILLKEGFSATAFLFSGLWFLYHKMWKESIAILALNVAFTSFDKFNLLSAFDLFCLEATLAVIVGLNANYWHSELLKKKNYEFSGVVFGNNELDAKIRFLNEKSSEVFAINPREIKKLENKKLKFWKRKSPLNLQTS